MRRVIIGFLVLMWCTPAFGFYDVAIGIGKDIMGKAAENKALIAKIMEVKRVLERLHVVEREQTQKLDTLHRHYKRLEMGEDLIDIAEDYIPYETQKTHGDIKHGSKEAEKVLGVDIYAKAKEWGSDVFSSPDPNPGMDVDTIDDIIEARQDRNNVPNLSEDGKENLNLKQNGQQVESMKKIEFFMKKNKEATEKLQADINIWLKSNELERKKIQDAYAAKTPTDDATQATVRTSEKEKQKKFDLFSVEVYR